MNDLNLQTDIQCSGINFVSPKGMPFHTPKDTPFHAKMGTKKDRKTWTQQKQKILRRGGKNTQENCTKIIFMTQIFMML